MMMLLSLEPIVKFDNQGNVVFIFEPQVGFRLHDCCRPEAVNPHKRLLKSVVPKERLALVSVRKYHR